MWHSPSLNSAALIKWHSNEKKKNLKTISLIEEEQTNQFRIKTEDNGAPLHCLLVQGCGDVPRCAALHCLNRLYI